MKQLDTEESKKLSATLLAFADELDRKSPENHWPWLEKRPIPVKDANKFLLLSMVDYRQRGTTPFTKVRDFTEKELGDPDLLWEAILRIPEVDWNSRTGPRSLHSTGTRHRKIRVMAQRLRDKYAGDATALWADRSPSNSLARLEELGLGPQVSRMVIGALVDEEQVDGSADVKADTHLKRVIGRILVGREFSEEEVTTATRLMSPSNPWWLDWPTWYIGNKWCLKRVPLCDQCRVNALCVFR